MEQRRGLGTRLAGALTIALALMLVLGVAGPLRADITAVSPSSVSVTGGQSETVSVSLSGGETCLGALASSPLIVVTLSTACNPGTGPWTTVATIIPDYDTPGGAYTVTFTETGDSSDVFILDVTVIQAPPTTTTTTQPEGTTTTTVPGATTTTTTAPTTTTTTAPAPTTTTTAPPAEPTTTTTTAPSAGETTTTTSPATPTTPPTTNEPTTTTSLATVPSDPTTTTVAADDEPFLAAPPIAPATGGGAPPAAPREPAADTQTAAPVVQALGARLPAPADTGAPTQALSLRDLAEAIPRTLRDLVISPFVIVGVIFGAIRDTGAATIWPLIIVIPLIVDWRAMQRRFRSLIRPQTS